MTAYLEAVATVRPRGTHRVGLGPDYPNGGELTRRDLSRLGVQIVAFDPDLTTAMAASEVVVSMAGYNTVCEALALGKRLVLVPRVWPRKEQWLRAQALAERSRAALVDPGQLTPRVLWNAVESVLAGPTPALIHPAGETRSAARAAQLLQTGAVV
jgi:predicted glycosyltransferase